MGSIHSGSHHRISSHPNAAQILELLFSGTTHLSLLHINQLLHIALVDIAVDKKFSSPSLKIVDTLFLISTIEGNELFHLRVKGILMDCCCLVVEKVLLFTMPCNKRIN